MSQAKAEFTTELVALLNQQIRPEFCGLPRTGDRCPISGLSRSLMNELILGKDPPVKSVCLRKKGKARGRRLVYVESLLRYLHSQMQSSTKGEAA